MTVTEKLGPKPIRVRRDTEILVFLWKWKAATTITIARRFFPNCSHIHQAYCRLQELRSAGLLERHRLGLSDDAVWTLGKLGFESIKPFFEGLKEDGYRSENFKHDLIVSAVHLGEWLDGLPDGVDVYTEQQLRRNSSDYYPEWVPQNFTRRPDGYWRIPAKVGHKVISLEVEMSSKTDDAYREIGYAYADTPSVSQVVWVVRSDRTANRLEKIFSELESERKATHDFLLLDEFLEQGWQTRFYCGPHANLSLASQLETRTGKTLGKPQGNLGYKFTCLEMLDARIAPYKSSRYKPRAVPLRTAIMGW